MHGGRKGSAAFFVRPGETLVLARERGTSGVVRRIWMTLSDFRPATLKSLKLEMRWDGAGQPAVSASIGDFFGFPLGTLAPFESALFSSPEARSFNCFAPMPFRTGMDIRVTNEGTTTCYQLYYEIDYTVGDRLDPDDRYFHAHQRAENPTRRREDYEILPAVRGRGRFLGAFVGVAADRDTWGNTWWGEGECKIWLDGDSENPTLCGTGTEDWIGTGWEIGGPHAGRTQGCHVADAARMRYTFYRWHLDDPVFFSTRVRVAMQQIGSWNPRGLETMRGLGRPVLRAGPGAEGADGAGPAALDFDEAARSQPHGLFEREDLWASCAFFYLDRPESGLPPAPPVAQRLAALPAFEEDDVKKLVSVPEVMRTLERWIPEVAKMSAAEMESVRDALAAVAAVVRGQEQVLADAEGDDEPRAR